MRLLDLFCGAGGCSVGYHRAGFAVIGVDNAAQPRYPFPFVKTDALSYLRNFVATGGGMPWHFDAIHASPPCQAYSETKVLGGNEHPDLIEPTRELLRATGLPYVIENVPGAPLIDPALLEGQMFDGLRTSRPRLFETNWPLDVPFLRSPRPRHAKMGRAPKGEEWIQVVGHFADVDAGREAMGIDWMTRDELSQAIPPAYTELIGHQLLAHINGLPKEAVDAA